MAFPPSTSIFLLKYIDSTILSFIKKMPKVNLYSLLMLLDTYYIQLVVQLQ